MLIEADKIQQALVESKSEFELRSALESILAWIECDNCSTLQASTKRRTYRYCDPACVHHFCDQCHAELGYDV